eukprot:g6005.t1
MTADRVNAGLVASAATALLLASHADGHSHQQFPISRQYSWSLDFYDFSFENVEGAPYAFNAGGVKAVRDRALANTNPSLLSQIGGGELFPLYFLDLAENGNYLEPNPVAKRTTPCGDPRLGWDDDEVKYSTPNGKWDVLHTFEPGQEIEIDVVIVYYHWGHMEFFLCDTEDLVNPNGVVTQNCLNKYPLTRAYNRNDASAIDPNFPGRYYVDPPCRADEVDQDVSDNFPDGSYNIKMRYKLPDIECTHCVLQMHYLTGNRCKHIGYDEFDPPSWNSECAPTTDKWIYKDNGICGEANAYPEEFWQCSDIALSRAATTGAAESVDPVASESPVLTTDSTDATCSNGVRGIEANGACCVFECGQCGGSGCSTVGESLGLGAADCCDSVVLQDNEPCGEAPCALEATTATTSETSYLTSSDTDTYIEDTPGTYEYLGCFKDSQEDRVLEWSEYNSPLMTTDVCFQHCYSQGATHMATQYSWECWCAFDGLLDYERHGDGAVCNYPCNGDETETCGGRNAFDLYKLLASDAPTTQLTPAPVMPIEPPVDDGCMVVIIEAETLAVTGDWTIVADPDASGGKYIVWEGLSESRNNQSPDDGDIIASTVDIPTPGTYYFKWLMRQPDGVETDKANDTWLNFPDAERFGPKGTTNNYGTFVKVYGRAVRGYFEYSGRAEDADHRHSEIAVEFAQAGEYVMEISGRSHGHQIDQIILFGQDPSGEDLSADEAAAGYCP